MADDPYAWRDPFSGITPKEAAEQAKDAHAMGYRRGRRDGVLTTRASEETRQAVHDEIDAYVGSLHFQDTFEHQWTRICMEAMKYVALNGNRRPPPSPVDK